MKNLKQQQQQWQQQEHTSPTCAVAGYKYSELLLADSEMFRWTEAFPTFGWESSELLFTVAQSKDHLRMQWRCQIEPKSPGPRQLPPQQSSGQQLAAVQVAGPPKHKPSNVPVCLDLKTHAGHRLQSIIKKNELQKSKLLLFVKLPQHQNKQNQNPAMNPSAAADEH